MILVPSIRATSDADWRRSSGRRPSAPIGWEGDTVRWEFLYKFFHDRCTVGPLRGPLSWVSRLAPLHHAFVTGLVRSIPVRVSSAHIPMYMTVQTEALATLRSRVFVKEWLIGLD